MITVTQRFTRVPWYGPNLVLSSSYAWKPYVELLRVVPNNSGASYASNNPAAPFNAYTTIQAGQFIDVIAKNIPTGGFQIDNGTAPSGGGTLPDPISVSLATPVSPGTETLFEKLPLFGKVSLALNGAPTNGATLLFSLNNSDTFANAATTSTAIAALNNVATNGYTLQPKLVHSNNVACTASFTATYLA